MSYEMETAEKKKESQLVMNHLQHKLTPYSALYWTQSIRQISFDSFIWLPCLNCKPCTILQKLIEDYSHEYLRVKENYQFIIISLDL
jgi:hypothetical protein